MVQSRSSWVRLSKFLGELCPYHTAFEPGREDGNRTPAASANLQFSFFNFQFAMSVRDESSDCKSKIANSVVPRITLRQVMADDLACWAFGRCFFAHAQDRLSHMLQPRQQRFETQAIQAKQATAPSRLRQALPME